MSKVNSPIKFKVAGYARVSSEDQITKQSIKGQVEYLKHWSDREGWDLIKIYQDDGFSGKNMIRPGLQALLKDAALKKFQAIICYNTDRLSRETKDSLNIAERLQVLGIGLRFGNLDLDLTTPEGEMIFSQLAVLAKFFRRDLGRKTSMGMQRRAHDGFHMGRAGDYFAINKNGKLSIKDPASVKRILHLRAHGHSYQFIGDDLGINAMKVLRVCKTCERLNIKNEQTVIC